MPENSIDIKSLGVGGLVVFLCFKAMLDFLKPLWDKLQSNKKTKSKSDDNILSKFIDYIKESLSVTIGRNIDATKEMHKDLAIVQAKTIDTHNKVSVINDKYTAIVKDVDDSIKEATKHYDENAKESMREVVRMFSNINNKLITLKCVGKDN